MRLLLVEDDTNLNESLSFQLEMSGFTVDKCFDGEEALYYAEQNIYDVILLDRMLPYMDGISVLETLRTANNHVPIILITALGSLSDRVSGLNIGADDYLVKPFAFEELLARIHCVTRRPQTLAVNNSLSISDITFHPDESKLEGPKESCYLSKRESTLFETLLRNHGQTVPRDTLLLKVWGPESDVESGNLDNYIHFLRQRLKSVKSRIEIKTIRGIGYQLSNKKE